MPNTLATNLNQVLSECGFVTPELYFGNSDQNILQIVALAQTAARAIGSINWQLLHKMTTIALTSATSYALPADFLDLVPDTLYQQGRWDRTDLSTTPAVWALLNAINGLNTLPIRVRIMGGLIHILNPQSGATLQFEYVSNTPIQTSGGNYAKLFAADDDIWLLDDRLFELEVKWRFKKEKGLEWQSDLQECSAWRNDVRGRDQGASTIIPNERAVSGVPYANLWGS